MKAKPYQTCDLMHNGVCVSVPCLCKTMYMQEKKEAEAAFEKELVTIIRPMIETDIVSLFASEEDLLRYEHYFCNGMEYMKTKMNAQIEELQKQLKWKDQQIKDLRDDRKNIAPF